MEHRYQLALRWTGNQGQGTVDYRSYARRFELTGNGKPALVGSADPAFRGDADRYNPEEMLIGALSACHLLSYLHVCAKASVCVLHYQDNPEGVLTVERGGIGRMREVTLHPKVTVRDPATIETAMGLHAEAHRECFIANSVNFEVRYEPAVVAHRDPGGAGNPA